MPYDLSPGWLRIDPTFGAIRKPRGSSSWGGKKREPIGAGGVRGMPIVSARYWTQGDHHPTADAPLHPEDQMNPTLQMLGSVCFGVALACSDGTAPVSGAGCGEEEQSGVVVDGSLRVTRVFITREYSQVSVGSENTTTRHYRVCQRYTCSEVLEDPAAELEEAEVTDALAGCTAQADAAWATGLPT